MDRIIHAGLQNLVGEMTEEDFQQYKSELEIIELKRGEVLFNQNDEADNIYILLSGKLEVNVLQPDLTQKRVGFVNRKETVGEMALITDDVRSASVIGYRNSILAKMTGKTFMDFCYSRPLLAINVSRFVVNRLKESLKAKRVIVTNNNLCLYNCSDTSITNSCIDSLIELYSDEKVYRIIDKTIIESILESKWENSSFNAMKIDQFINERDINDVNLIFDLRGMDRELILHIIDYSDIIIQYFDASVVLSAAEIEAINALGSNADRKIRHIFCHDRSVVIPRNIMAKLSQLRQGAHTHVREGNMKDTMRIFRYMKGTTNSVVLGGGGAKGIAHLGVLKALEEFNIPIHYIAGTSMGAIYAGVYAIHQDFDTVFEMSETAFNTNFTSRRDLNLIPRHAVYSDKKINKILAELFQDYQIEDLWLPFYCVSSNISRPEMHVHESGSLKDAIRASMSVPGLFKPVIIDNEIHVDGGVFNNIPIDIMIEKNNGHIIASRVDVETKKKKVELPSLLTTVMKSAVANSDRHSNNLQKFVDVIFQPNVAHFGLLNWKAHKQIFEEGYRHASELLTNSKDTLNYLKDTTNTLT